MKDVKIKMGRSGPPPMNKHSDYLNPGQDDQMEIQGYVPNKCKTVVVWFFILLTLGFLRLFFFWLPHWMVRATHDKCSLEQAKVVVMRDQYEQWFVSKVKPATQDNVVGGKLTDLQSLDGMGPGKRTQSILKKPMYYFITKKVKYVWNDIHSKYEKLSWLDDKTGCSYLHECDGISFDEQVKRRCIFGSNNIQVHVTPVLKLLFKEALTPFYIFQLFSCILWYIDEYEYYASCIVLLSILSLVSFIYQTRKMQRALRNTIHSCTIVTVCRANGVYEDISSEDLVPGDVIVIPTGGCMMQCDAALVTGNCIVNESMLTGESVPITKTPLPNPKAAHTDEKVFNLKDHSRHVLFCGTRVIQTRYYGDKKVKAVVFRTGFSTSKGSLVRSILFPKPVDFKFSRDTYIFVGILAGIAAVGFLYTIILNVMEGEDPGVFMVDALDLITIAVPPALPAALTFGIVFAQRRLKKKNIYCISPNSINVSGTINAFCFDKTGTLTADGLDMQSVHPANNGRFDEELTDLSSLNGTHMQAAMATCHSLTIIDNEVSGDPLDLIMFQQTQWELEEPGEEHSRFDMMVPTIVYPKPNFTGQQPDREIGVLRQFTFSSSLQRMSVITRTLGGNNFELYTKGSPEMVVSLSRPETVPPNFHDVLMGYTRHGYRVIALAWRPLPEKLKYTKIHRLQREQVENGLTFLGLMIFENRIKSETAPIIHQLKEANIRTIMVTGDNMLTALSVARECSMVAETDNVFVVQAYPQTDKTEPTFEFINADDFNEKVEEIHKTVTGDFNVDMKKPRMSRYFHFAMDGRTWSVMRNYFPDALGKLAVRGTIFARMSPDQKSQLVELLQDLGYFVGMCGDGANDCGALKTAHAGISLSEAEASVASPFTSKKPNIECVASLISEGRTALVTSFGVFKFMACYSLTQFLSVCILYWVDSSLTDFQFLYIDLVIITTLAITFGRTGSYEKLYKEPPLVKLFSIAPILSMLGQVAVVAAVQIFCWFIIQNQAWFVPFVPNEDEEYRSLENMTLFVSSSYQYIILAIVMAKGRPYRKSIFTNYWFMGNLAVVICITLWITIYPTDGFADFLELEVAPSVPFRFLYIGVAVINLSVALLFEMFVIDSRFISRTLQTSLEKCCNKASYKYKVLEEQIEDSPQWPPIVRRVGTLAEIFERMDSVQPLVVPYDKMSLTDSVISSDDNDESVNPNYIDIAADDKSKQSDDRNYDKTYINEAFSMSDESDNYNDDIHIGTNL